MKVAYCALHRHDSDAFFRAWGSRHSQALAAIGLVQTADTGQINWSTVVRAAINTDAGYEIWRFNDSMQATAPLYFKFNYGTGGVTTTGRLQVQMGTGSNGSGTLTGTTTTARVITEGNGAWNVDQVFRFAYCHVDGFLGMQVADVDGAFAGNHPGHFAAMRTIDSAGLATATGAMACWKWGDTTHAFRYAATAVDFGAQTAQGRPQLTLFPQSITGTRLQTGELQAMLCFIPTPQIQPLIGLLGVIEADFPEGNTFDCTPAGLTQRTYLALKNIGIANSLGQAGKLAMLWE